MSITTAIVSQNTTLVSLTELSLFLDKQLISLSISQVGYTPFYFVFIHRYNPIVRLSLIVIQNQV